MPGTTYFQDKQKKSLNSMVNSPDTWQPSDKYVHEFDNAIQRAHYDLEDGILNKFRALRTKQLENLVAQNCYTGKKFTFDEAEFCEKYHYENDYKLNLINTFWADHIPKHANTYLSCLTKTGV